MLRGLVDTMLADRKLFIFLSGLMSVGGLEDLGPATYAELFREAITDLLEPWDIPAVDRALPVRKRPR